jgi:para-nitrobenzyl esterase
MEAGTLEGTTRDGVDAFLGIPYAEPPVGTRRFRAPVRAARWDGVRPAVAFGASAPQPAAGALAGLVPGMAVGATSEDCLTLNVWTPGGRSEEPLPVMVWLHGGAFTLGGSSLATYDPTRLVAEQGVVVVSANYRLGALGWLCAGGIDSNCGLRDQLLALDWVAAHIGSFGGDPARVTVFGESAGAGSGLHLLATGGAFHQAILQSPGCRQTLTPAKAEVVARTFLGKLDAGPREASVERILAAQAETAAELATTVGSMVFHPAVDGELLSDTPLALARAGRLAPRPLIAGTTTEEMRLFADARMARLERPVLARVLRGMVATELGTPVGLEEVESVMAAYEGDVFTAVGTDVVMRLPLEEFLDAYAGPAYAYSFAWDTGPHGACHASDLPFTFGTLDHPGWAEFVAADQGAWEVSARMRAAWAAFARDGAPGPGWPRYEVPERPTMTFGRTTGVFPDPLADARRRCAPITKGLP